MSSSAELLLRAESTGRPVAWGDICLVSPPGDLNLKEGTQALAGGSVGWRVAPYTKRLQVQFPLRAHTEVACSIFGQSAGGRQPMDVFVSH